MFGDLIGSICDALLAFVPEGSFLASLVTTICGFLSDVLSAIGDGLI